MNLTQDGRVEWTDRGILFSAGLFSWLVFAAAAQWFSSTQGRGEWTALVSILSFVIVVAVLGYVISTPHGREVQARDVRAYDPPQPKVRFVELSKSEVVVL